MEVELDQLIDELNQGTKVEISVYILSGVGLISKTAVYDQFCVEKDQEGEIYLEAGEIGYSISNEYEISKMSSGQGEGESILYEIRKDDLLYVSICLNN